MSNHLQAEFEKLWTSAQIPPDVVQFLGCLADPSPNLIGAIVKLDQQYRWKTAVPMTVEDYLDAMPEWRTDRDLILEFTAGEFLARLDVQHLPHVGEYAARFPHLESEVRQKLSGLSTNGAVNTSLSASIRDSLDRVFDIDDICDAFEQVWRESPTPPFIEAWVLHGRREDRKELLKELLRVELCVRVERKEAPTLQDYRQRFPNEWPFHDILNDWQQHPQKYILTVVPSTRQVSPKDVNARVIGQFALLSSQSGTLELDGTQRIGHFRLLKQLGRGTFGRVYRAHDEQLDRAVAIKVPRRSRFRRPEDAEAYLSEARTVARLDHPGIVPVYQAGRSDDGSVYVVSRLIEGRSLEEVIKDQRPEFSTTAQLILKVARALHFAHQHRVIHRDIKPANILIDDATGTPFVADFGLAMKEEDYLKQAGTLAGTPAYMSPEQARAEGHRLDGRSDLFSLGIVLYELLTGKRPFRGSTANETLHQVISVDPRPPRSIDETIPAELERICLKAISKRTSDRYATAEVMAEDLEAWLKPVSSPVPDRKTDVQVVPKGLRSFDANDADFFLDLLPGTRNRDGLPESVAFWKQRIEETDPEKTFNVGLIYGPSGCGKSSLVKAGLLPHLSKDVIAVYLEATPDETELRILRGLRKRVPSLDLDNEPPHASSDSEAPSGEPQGTSRGLGTPALTPVASAIPLTETLLQLRRSSPQKIVIIIDQFEQWLHTHRVKSDAELVAALRQCDGVHVQAIVMIRDDFAMAAARFMQALDVAILQGHNFTTVDLFEVDHARNVLIKFGQSFGKLPANSDNLSAEEQQFVNDVANGLAQDGKVVSVRLSLFAEMIKAKRWSSETLQAVGGTEGIGVNFLEETFGSPQANPRHRLQATAARAVLKSLLPEFGSDIKGHMRSQQELLGASGYADRSVSGKALAAGPDANTGVTTPAASAMPLTTNIDFNDLLRILDGELRLITPTDPEGDSLSGDLSRNSSLATRFFQLTHDYLVPSLREWLTRKQKETRRGRAELKLAERSASWNAKPERRYLPTLIEWLYFRSFTSPANWSSNERRMMGNAKRILATTWLIGMASVSAIIIPSLHRYQSREREFVLQQVRTAVDAAANSRGVALPHSIRDLKQYPQSLVVDELKSRINNEDAFPNLGLTCALAEFGTVDSEFLVAQVDTVSDEDASNLLMALKSDSNAALKHLKLAASVSTENKQWEHKAKLSILALHLDDVEIVAEMCRVKGQSDLTQRSVFIDVFSRWDLDTYSLATLIDNDDQQDFRSGMCLAVGQMPVKYLSPKEIARWQDLAAQWYSRKSDAGTHSASVWLLRKLESVVPKVGSSSDAEILNDWYETTTGLTMLRIPDGESVYDPGTKVRSFWMCDREVSIANFELFLTDPDLTADEKPTKSPQAHSKTSPSIDHPVQQVSWYDAVLFCNWLSRKEGLDVAYKKIGKSNLPSVYQGRTSPDVWATDLRANGYRLPTTHEWMRACHADTVTTFSSGNDEVLQTQYAHFRASACLVCGEKMPNGFGLFDLEGNVSEWLTDDDVDREQIRQVGGGAFNRVVADQLVLLNTATAEDESYVIGFRPVRRN